MRFSIRKATSADLPVLNEISLESKRYWGYPDEWVDRWRDDLTITIEDLDQHQVYVLEVENTVAGFSLIAERMDYYEIDHLWLRPDYIGKGYGKILFDESVSKSVYGAKRLMVTSDPNAEPFYTKMGFKTVSKEESYPKGRFLPVMEKLIR